MTGRSTEAPSQSAGASLGAEMSYSDYLNLDQVLDDGNEVGKAVLHNPLVIVIMARQDCRGSPGLIGPLERRVRAVLAPRRIGRVVHIN